MARNATSFVKGDPRINRKGRPKTFDEARNLAKQIAHETVKAGGNEVVIDGHIVTVTEMILRQWATSKDARLQQAFMEWAYGKPPQDIRHGGEDGGPIRHLVNLADLSDDQLNRIKNGESINSVIARPS